MELILTKGTELNLFRVENILYISSDGNYSHIHTSDGHFKLITTRLGEVEKQLRGQAPEYSEHFLRVGRGLVINSSFLQTIDLKSLKIVLHDGRNSFIELASSREALLKLKKYFEVRIRS